jgi:hypothetical protein
LGPVLAGAIADATQSYAPTFLLAGGLALVLGGGGTLLLQTRANIPGVARSTT